MGLRLYASLNGVPLGDGSPILTCLGGDIVLTELGQFSSSSVVLAAADEQAILAMQPYTVIEVVQDNLLTPNPLDPGTLVYGYVLDPEQSITDRDEHTITVELAPLTTECTWRRVWDWQANNNISIIAERIGALTPGWTGIFTDRYHLDPTGQPYDIGIIVKEPSASNLALFINTATNYSHFVRQGVDSNGVPTRTLEMGQFGADPTITLQDPKGGDPEVMADNLAVRLPATITRHPNDVRDLVNVTAPFGGGQDRDSLVTLERLWRILNDPLYPDYGRYGNQPFSLFPEYNPNTYPISDPDNPPTGMRQWLFLDANGNQVGGTYGVSIGTNPDGSKTAYAVTAQGVAVPGVYPALMQGILGTRGYTTDGHFLYYCYDRISYLTYGYKGGEYVDSSLTYTDPSVVNQTTTARALYASVISQFERFAHPHHSFTCTAEGKGRPTRAGDLITVDYQRVSVPDTGAVVAAVVEMNVTETLRVMKITRSFQGENPPVDTYTLSNLGRFDQDDASQFTDVARQLPAIQMSVGTGIAKDSVVIRDNIDAANPITHFFYVPPEHFRYHTVRVRCDFFSFRGTANTAQQQTTDDVVTIGDVDFIIPAYQDLAAGSQALPAPFKHFHQVPVGGATLNMSIPSVPYNSPPNLYMWIGGSGNPNASGGGGMSLRANTSSGGSLATGVEIYNTDMSPTAHTHSVAKAGDQIAHIPKGTNLAPLPKHIHPIEQRIPTGQPSPASITLYINGMALPSGAQTTGTRDSSGAFTSGFVAEIGPYLEGIAPGTDVPLVFSAGTSGSNLSGVGYLVVTITSVEELGGLASKVTPA